MHFALSFFGPMEVTSQGRPVTFATNSARALLAYVVLERRPQSRELLATLLWPDQSQAAAYTNLRQTLARVRKGLPLAPALLQVTQQTLQFQPAAATVDVIRFEELLAECAVHAHVDLDRCPVCLQRLEQASALYRGELLEGLFMDQSQPFEEWLLVRREALHRQALATLQTVTRAHEAAGDYERMHQYAARQIVLEPWREDAHMAVIRALAYSGQREAALAQYDTCRRALEQELGIEPGNELQALVDRIRADELGATTPPQRYNLPAQLTPFVGRERELAEIAARLHIPDVRLLTLVGMGGMGKTRLALHAARAMMGSFTDGVWFVALASVASPSAVVSTIAAALNLHVQSSDPWYVLQQTLHNKRCLLVFDNFEHLLEGADIVAAILEIAPQVTIIATSRAPLRLHCEHVYDVQALEYPHAATLADAATAPAVRLFAQTAQRVRADWTLHAENVAAVLRICQLVQGMPLGLELAAAWVTVLPLDVIAAEIERSMDFLASEWRDVPARQQSMRVIFDWSWHVLTATEREVLRQVSVFRGGFTRDAAQAMFGVSLRVLAGLIQKFLLSRDAVGRYHMHELLRQYSAEHLDRDPVAFAHTMAQQSAYYLRFVAERYDRLTMDDTHQAMAEVSAELDNVRQAWEWAVAHGMLTELEQASFALLRFYNQIGLLHEGANVYGMAATHLRRWSTMHPDDAQRGDQLVSLLLAMHAAFQMHLGKYEDVVVVSEEVTRLGAASGQTMSVAMSHMHWGSALVRMGKLNDGKGHLQRAMELAHKIYPYSADHMLWSLLEAEALGWLGGIDVLQGDTETAIARHERVLQLCRRVHYRWGECIGSLDLAEAYVAEGNYGQAWTNFEQAMQIARTSGLRLAEAVAYIGSSMVAGARGEYSTARDAAVNAQTILHEIGSPMHEALAMTLLARALDDTGAYAQAQEVLEDALALGRARHAREPELEALIRMAYVHFHTGAYAHGRVAAEQAIALAQTECEYMREAHGWVALGYNDLGLFDLARAQEAFGRALRGYEQLRKPFLAIGAQAGLAQVAYQRGDLPVALAYVEEILDYLADHPVAGPAERSQIYLTCATVLDAFADDRAAAIRALGAQQLRDQAAAINDPALRQGLLEVATNRTLLESMEKPADLCSTTPDEALVS